MQLLFVDLTTGRVRVELCKDSIYRGAKTVKILLKAPLLCHTYAYRRELVLWDVYKDQKLVHARAGDVFVEATQDKKPLRAVFVMRNALWRYHVIESSVPRLRQVFRAML